VRISAKSEYAILALAELADKYASKQLVRLEEIAKNQDIPQKYLVQIFLQLKRLGLVKSKRGAHGGYFLGASPDQITLRQIISAVEGPLLTMQCIADNPADKCKRAETCGFKEIWFEVREKVNKLFDEITLEDISKKCTIQIHNYII
jgi:Rrf2 family protein